MSRIVYSFTNITDLHSRGVLKGTSDGGSQNVIVFTNNTTLIRSNNNASTKVFHCKSVGLIPPENVVSKSTAGKLSTFLLQYISNLVVYMKHYTCNFHVIIEFYISVILITFMLLSVVMEMFIG